MAYSGTEGGDSRKIRWFLFWGAFLSGVVLLGTMQTLSLMLTEKKVGATAISCVMLAAIPYSWKFLLSPFVKNVIVRRAERMRIIKGLAIISQLIVLAGLLSIGFCAEFCSVAPLYATVALTVTAISVHDIVRAYVKLKACDKQDLGVVTSIENIGFRLGMLVAGAGLLYIADAIGWRLAYIAISVPLLPALLSTVSLSRLETLRVGDEVKNEKFSLVHYVKACINFFRTKGIFLLALVMMSFKFADSCINGLKGMFLHSIGIGKLLFANISQVAGVFTMIIGGSFAGFLLTKIGSKKCAMFTFAFQCLASAIFIFLSSNKVSVATLTLLINVSTFIFGFSNVVFRTFIAEQSDGDVNIDSMLLSVGSAFRIFSCSIGGFIIDH
ncbi:MAG: hypothetical protein LBJ42_02405, partial [Holosporales bacterium]|nr:hypothetical protein [Holosporales bacterium]